MRLNNILEDSGNVMCLDVLSVIKREPTASPAIMTELDSAKGGHPQLDRAITELKKQFKSGPPEELRVRLAT